MALALAGFLLSGYRKWETQNASVLCALCMSGNCQGFTLLRPSSKFAAMFLPSGTPWMHSIFVIVVVIFIVIVVIPVLCRNSAKHGHAYCAQAIFCEVIYTHRFFLFPYG